ncbi:12142_t:CDS:2 [Gigaspora margarita]|uniref:12142_t:CDS:1 n=1 Tax=Gigaspora margarita TaxID=4874 RepID=A0ABN7UT81_GIGMA|nr:12142_t:CDS:2 [Gigaspora margarita]
MDGDANQNQTAQNEELVKSIFDGVTFTPTNTEIPQQPPSFVELWNQFQNPKISEIGKKDEPSETAQIPKNSNVIIY